MRLAWDTAPAMTLSSLTPVHRELLVGPSIWDRSSFSEPGNWTYRLGSETVSELDRALSSIRRAGKNLASLTTEEFNLPALRRDSAGLRHEIASGRGFLLLRGLDLSRYSEEEASILFWGIGTSLGSPLPQNAKGDRLFSVRDEGYTVEKNWGQAGVRLSKTAERLHFHTDSAPAVMGGTPDCVALLALQVAKAGGASALVSAKTIHNIMLLERPDYLERLYRPYHFDRRAERLPGESPTLNAPIFRYDEELKMRYLRFYIVQPVVQELAGITLTVEDLNPLDYIDEIVNRQELQVCFQMEPGDIQLVNNNYILHSRTAFADHSEPERRRHLKRLWLTLHTESQTQRSV